MLNLSKLAAALLFGAMISASAVAAGKAFVTVNGVAVSQTLADALMAEQKAKGAPDSPELKNAVREELIRRELVAQEAKKAGLEKKPDIAVQADAARQGVFIRAYICLLYTSWDQLNWSWAGFFVFMGFANLCLLYTSRCV